MDCHHISGGKSRRRKEIMIKLQLNHEMNEEIISSYQKDVERINKMIDEKSGPGNDFLGWVDWPVNYDQEELERIIKDTKYVREHKLKVKKVTVDEFNKLFEPAEATKGKKTKK